MRGVMTYASDHDSASGLQFATQLIAQLRAYGAFDPHSENYAGASKVDRLRKSLDRVGHVLDTSGALRPRVIDNLSGTELTAALQAYVDRINANPLDAPLQIGTGKDLDEAVAKHVLERKTGGYPDHGRAATFPFILAQAFTVIGLSVPSTSDLDPDPHRAVQQSLFQLAIAVNRLRNDAGTGHGRPSGPRKTDPLMPEEARLVARATALIAGAMLDAL